MSKNPFHLRWNRDWFFLFFLEGGNPKIEASGYGIEMTTQILRRESHLGKRQID